MTPQDPKTILDDHAKWMRGEGGKRADLRGAYLRGAGLYGANLRDADLSGANLYGANLRRANLYGADLRDANLNCANLGGANLRDAVLGGAYLRGAVLGGADLRGADLGYDRKAVGLIARATRTIDPYEFFAWRTDKGDFVKAGCNFLSVEEYRAHVAKKYQGSAKAVETLRILDFIERAFKETATP